VFAQPPVDDVGVDAVLECNGCNGGASLTALAHSLEFELWTVKPPLGIFGVRLARHGVHDLHRAHYLRGSARAQDGLPGRIRHYRLHGIGGSRPKRSTHNPQFKLKVLSYQDREQLSCRQGAAAYVLRNFNRVVLWRRNVDEGGAGLSGSGNKGAPV